jgi:hypothetical protein
MELVGASKETVRSVLFNLRTWDSGKKPQALNHFQYFKMHV